MNKQKRNKTFHTLMIFILIGLICSEELSENLEEKVK